MAELAIYDSQGNGIGRHAGQQSQRIKDLFFDGVRLAVDKSGQGCEVICFFRARESSASRSEQYYSVYTSQRSAAQAIQGFAQELEQRIENQHDMSFVTTTEDTEVFEHLYNYQKQEISDTNTLDEVIEMLDSGGGLSTGGSGGLGGSGSSGGLGGSGSSGGLGGSGSSGGLGGSGGSGRGGGSGFTPPNQAKVGVGSYRDAIGVVQHIASDVSGYAITENADSTHLKGYEVVVEKGQYVGVELFDETQQAIEEMKRQRRAQMQPNYGSTGGDDGFGRRKMAFGAVAVLGLGAVLIYAACLLGFPIHDAIPGCDSSDDGIMLETAALNGENGLDIEATNLPADVAKNSTQSIVVEIRPPASSGNGESSGTQATEPLASLDREVTVENGSVETTISAASLNEALADDMDVADLEAGTHTVTIEYESERASRRLQRRDIDLSIDGVEWTETETLNLTGTLEAGNIEEPELTITVEQNGENTTTTTVIENYGETKPELSVELSEIELDPTAGGNVTVEYNGEKGKDSFEPLSTVELDLGDIEPVEEDGSITGLDVSVTATSDGEPVQGEEITVQVQQGPITSTVANTTDDNGAISESIQLFEPPLNLSEEVTVVAEYDGVTQEQTVVPTELIDSEQPSLTVDASFKEGEDGNLTLSVLDSDGGPVTESSVNITIRQNDEEKLSVTRETDGNAQIVFTRSELEKAMEPTELFTVTVEHDGVQAIVTVSGDEQESDDDSENIKIRDAEWKTNDDDSVVGLTWEIYLIDKDENPISNGNITIRIKQNGTVKHTIDSETNASGINTGEIAYDNEDLSYEYYRMNLESYDINATSRANLIVTYDNTVNDVSDKEIILAVDNTVQRTRYGSLPAMNLPRSETWRKST